MRRAQTSVEYLLLTTGVILVGVIASQAVVSSGTVTHEAIKEELNNIAPVDTVPPTTELLCEGGTCYSQYNHDINLGFLCNDNLGGSGCARTVYNITQDGNPYDSGGCNQQVGECTNVATLKAPTTGAYKYTIVFHSEDMQGNTEKQRRVTIKIGEASAPTCTFGIKPSFPKPGETALISAKVTSGVIENATLRISTVSPPSEIKTENCGDMISGSECTTTIHGTGGEITARLEGNDIFGGPTQCGPESFIIDGIPPTATYTLVPLKTWYSSDVDIQYVIHDPPPASGGWYISYTVDNSVSQAYGTSDEGNTGTIQIPIGTTKFCNIEGIDACVVTLTPHDRADNMGVPQKIDLNIDLTPPTTSASCSPSSCESTSSVSVSLSCSDTLSGCAKTYYCKDSSNTCTPSTEYSGLISVSGSPDTYYVRFYSVDVAGNIEPTKSIKVSIKSSPPPPNTCPQEVYTQCRDSCVADPTCTAYRVTDPPSCSCLKKYGDDGCCAYLNYTRLLSRCDQNYRHTCTECGGSTCYTGCSSASDCSCMCNGQSTSNCGGDTCLQTQACCTGCQGGCCLKPWCGAWSCGGSWTKVC